MGASFNLPASPSSGLPLSLSLPLPGNILEPTTFGSVKFGDNCSSSIVLHVKVPRTDNIGSKLTTETNSGVGLLLSPRPWREQGNQEVVKYSILYCNCHVPSGHWISVSQFERLPFKLCIISHLNSERSLFVDHIIWHQFDINISSCEYLQAVYLTVIVKFIKSD